MLRQHPARRNQIKRLLAIFLVTLALLSVFAVGASAAQPERGIIIEGNATIARVPACIMRRQARYDSIAAQASPAVQDEIFAIINPSTTTTITSQLQLNRYLNTQNNQVAQVLRTNGYQNWFSSLWSWFLGNLWWVWAPLLIAIPVFSAIGAFYTVR